MNAERFNRMCDEFSTERFERAMTSLIEFTEHMFGREVSAAEASLITDSLTDAITEIIEMMYAEDNGGKE